MELEFGRWALVKVPSLLALIPLIIYIVMAFRGKNNVSGLIAGIAVAAILMGIDLKTMAKVFQTAMGSTTVMIGLIIMTGHVYTPRNRIGL